MITAIEIENFKAIGERVRVELKSLTLIFGPNSAGKSTIIQAIHYAREILERHYLDPHRVALGGDAIDLGGFENFVHNQDKGLPIRLRFDIDLTGSSLPVYRDEYIDDLDIEDTDVSRRFEELFGRMSSAWAEIEVRWVDGLGIVVTKYTVGLNGRAVAATKLDDYWMRLLFGIRVPGTSGGSEDDEIQRVLSEASAKIPPEQKHQLRSRSRFCVLDIDWSHPLLVADTGLLQALTELVSDFTAGEELQVEGRLERQIPSVLPQWEQVMSIEGYRAEAGRDTDYVYRWTALCCGLSRMIVGPGELVRDELRKFRYLGPLREMPSRGHKPLRFPAESSWAKGLAAWDALCQADAGVTELARESPTKEPMVAEPAAKQRDDAPAPKDGHAGTLSIQEVNHWFDKRLKAGYEVRLKSCTEVDTQAIPAPNADRKEIERFLEQLSNRATTRRVVLVADGQAIEVQPHDVGTGVSQLLPVVVLALDAQRSLVAIEQPELHLHPALQTELGDLFVESALRRSNTLLIETHSEHLILRLLRRIRETTLRPDQVSVIYVENGEQGMKLSQLRIDESGEFIDRWPKGFFAERRRELL